MNERRRHKRYSVPEGVHVAFASPHTKMGKLKDISRGGLAFEYIPIGSYEPERAHWVKVDIFKHDVDFFVLQIPCRVVYEIDTTDKSHSPSRMITMRCGLQFGELDQAQRQKLECFIEKCKS